MSCSRRAALLSSVRSQLSQAMSKALMQRPIPMTIVLTLGYGIQLTISTATADPINVSRNQMALGRNSLTHSCNSRCSVSDIRVAFLVMKNKQVDHHLSGFSMTETKGHVRVTEVGGFPQVLRGS